MYLCVTSTRKPTDECSHVFDERMKEKKRRSIILTPRESGMNKHGVNVKQRVVSDRYVCNKHTAYRTADWLACSCGKSFSLSFPFTCSTFLLPTSSLLCWPCCVFCQPPSSPPSLPPSILTLTLTTPFFPSSVSFLCLSLSSSTRVARSYRDSDHRGNLWEKSGLVLGSIKAREGEKETEKDTGATVCERERERERERGRKRAACFEQDAIRWLVCEL